MSNNAEEIINAWVHGATETITTNFNHIDKYHGDKCKHPGNLGEPNDMQSSITKCCLSLSCKDCIFHNNNLDIVKAHLNELKHLNSIVNN